MAVARVRVRAKAWKRVPQVARLNLRIVRFKRLPYEWPLSYVPRVDGVWEAVDAWKVENLR